MAETPRQLLNALRIRARSADNQRHTGDAPEREGVQSRVLVGGPEIAEVQATVQGPGLDDQEASNRRKVQLPSHHGYCRPRRFFPLSLGASRVLVVLAPIAATFGFASTTAISRWSSRNEAVTARKATLELDSLIQARAAINDEYVPS